MIESSPTPAEPSPELLPYIAQWKAEYATTNEPEIVIYGTFSWLDDEVYFGCSRVVNGVVVARNAFGGQRPKWWQFLQRYQLLRMIERLPAARIFVSAASGYSGAAP